MFFEEHMTLTLAIDRVNGVCNSFPHDGVYMVGGGATVPFHE